MKKNLMAICLLLCSIVALAGNPLKNMTGKDQLKSMLSENAKAVVEVDWSNAKYDKNKDLKESFGEDYDYILRNCPKRFIEGFNDKSNGLKLTQDATDAKYKVVLKVTNIDHYFNVMGFGPMANEAKMWGSLEIIDIATGTPIVTSDIDEAEDGKDIVLKDCYGKTFRKLGERIAKIK